MFDVEAAAGDDFEDIENQDEQVEPLKEKRVLDLGPFNDEDEEIELLKSGGAAEEQLKKKKVKKRRVFNENMMTSAAGLERMYEEFPDQCKYVEGNEAAAIGNLMKKYKEWAFQLYPNLAFPDMMNRCQALGSKAHVRGYMETLRERERHRYLRDVLGVASEDIIMSHTVAPEDYGPGSPSPAPGSARKAPGLDEDPEEAEWGRITGGNTSGGNGGIMGGADEDDEMDYDWDAIDALATQEQSAALTARKTADEEALEEWMMAAEQEQGQGEGEDEDEAEAWAEMEAMDQQQSSETQTQEKEKDEEKETQTQTQTGQEEATESASSSAGKEVAPEEEEDEDELEIVQEDGEGDATQSQAQ